MQLSLHFTLARIHLLWRRLWRRFWKRFGDILDTHLEKRLQNVTKNVSKNVSTADEYGSLCQKYSGIAINVGVSYSLQSLIILQDSEFS